MGCSLFDNLQKMRKIVVFIALLALTLVGCKDEPAPSPELQLTSPAEATFTSEGGLGVLSFVLSNPDGESAITAQATVEWLSEIVVGGHSITYRVAPNPTVEERSGEIVVQYDTQELRVAVKQEGRAYDYVFEAEAFAGAYYGTRYSDTPNYYFCLAEKVGSGNVLMPKSVAYYIDLYGAEPEDMENIALPTGVYTLDADNGFAAGTLSAQYSHYFCTDKDGYYSDDDKIGFTSATLTVTADCITLDAVSADGKYHHITYSGAAICGDQSVASPDYFTTLTGDYELDLSDAEMLAEYYHDFYCDWEGNWLLYIMPSTGTGDMLTFDIVTDELSFERGIDDTYNGVMTFAAHSFVPGKMENWGSWYYRYSGGKKSGIQAPLMGGTLTITKNDDGTHTVVLDAYDDAPTPNKVTAHWTGVVEMVDKSSGVGPAGVQAQRISLAK